MKTLIRSALVAVLLLVHMPGKTEDIDLFVASTLNAADKPNVLFVIDNTANWAGPFTNEMAAIKLVIDFLPNDVFKVGIMLANETGAPNNNIKGGYVRAAVREITSTTKPAYSNLVASFVKSGPGSDVGNGGYAGLTMEEAYRYFAGIAPYAGNNKVKTDYKGNVSGTAQDKAIYGLVADAAGLNGNALNAMNGSPYNSPIGSGCAKNFIIFVSNGANQENASAVTLGNADLSSFGGDNTKILLSPSGSQDSPVDEWARFMKKKSGLDITTYTLDIDKVTTGQGPGWTALLKSTAAQGGGKYFDISSAGGGSAVAIALANIFAEIQAVNSVFAAVSLPISANTQGSYLNQIFIGMFRPDAQSRPRWAGNLKQYKLGYTDSTKSALILQDADNTSAINNTTGFITECARSFWTPPKLTPGTSDNYWGFAPIAGCADLSIALMAPKTLADADSPDGNIVEKGAQGYMLRKTKPSNRFTTTCNTTFLTCASTSALDPFDTTNSVIVASDLGVTTAANRDLLINWGRGQDVDFERDATGAAMRPSVHGDVVHSRPVALNYGDAASPKVAVFYGANDGFLRAINGDRTGTTAGDELWSFIPPEFFKDKVNNVGNLDRLRNNKPEISYPGSVEPTAIPKPYGFDGALSSYTNDSNGDGIFDTAYLFGGLRRGGRAMYAFDVSNMYSKPTTTSLLWKVGCPNQTNDISCTTGFSEIGQTWGTAVSFLSADDPGVPKVIFGGGYDTCEDLDTGNSTTFNACNDKGNRIYVLDAQKGKLLATFKTDRPVVADVALLKDKNGDVTYGYAADMGGNVYRLSGKDPYLPIGTEQPNNWTLTKIAHLGCDTDTTCTPNRKFMFTPDVVVDAKTGTYTILLGSGDREKPLNYYKYAASVSNYFFGIVDKPSDTSWLTDQCGSSDYDCLSSLTYVDPAKASTTVGPRGWYLGLRPTEQVVTSSITVFGTVTFSTHTPAVPKKGTCSSLGDARVYNILYSDASAIGATRDETISGGGLAPSPVAGLVTLDDGSTVPFIIGADGDSPLQGGIAKTPGTTTAAKTKVYWNIEQ